VEINAYAVMSNHLHVVLRTLPARVAGWCDEEVARRWLRIFPGQTGTRGPGKRPLAEQQAVGILCRDPAKLALCRARLADLSWFMRSLNEPIARRANREDQCSGRFWEGRFKCQRLDDPGAVLACMAYVDLNPVRAGVAQTPEESRFTSARDRARALRARRQLACAPEDAIHQPSAAQAALVARARADARRDRWLAPIGPVSQPANAAPQDQNGGNPGDSAAPAMALVSPALPAAPPPPDGAATPTAAAADPPPLLPHFSTERYLELLDWTGRQIRSGKRGRIDPQLRPLLERLDLDVEAWVDNVEAYGGLFRRLAGKLKRLGEVARASGRAWLHGHCGARRLYARTA
jgi:REP element-mobilizing transposase RayT